MEVDDGRNAISSEEVSLNGSLNEDGERTLSDSELKNLMRSNSLAEQIKSPSSNEIERECTKQRLADSKSEPTDDDNCNEWIDILGNGDLLKKVVRKGIGSRPEPGDLVKIVWKQLDNEGHGEQEMQFILGYGFHAEALDMSVPLMSAGEVAHIKTHSRFLDDFNVEDFREYEIELLDIQPADTVDLNIRVNDAREWGNIYFKKGKYEKAYRLYEYGISVLSSVDPNETADELELRKWTLISNASACLLKLGKLKKVVEITENLPLSTNFDKLILTKMALRRSDALMQLKNYREAIVSLEVCLKIDPSNTRAKSLLNQTKNLNAKEETRIKNVYKNMFKALGTEEPTTDIRTTKLKSFGLTTKLLLIALSVGAFAGIFHFLRPYFN